MQTNPRHLLKALYDTLPLPVIVASLERTILDANAATLETFGYGPDELRGQPTAILYAQSGVSEEIRARIAARADSGERLQVEARFRRRDGSEFDGQIAVNVVDGDDGRPEAYVGIIQDMTPVRASQAERLKIENILTGALATIKEGFAVYDADDRLVLCNDAYREIYAISAPAMTVGARFVDILRYGLAHGQYPEAGESEESRSAWLARRLALHEDARGEAIVQQVGADRWVQVEERRTENNFRVGVRTDISGLLRMRSEAERLGKILESVSQEIYVIDPASWRLRSANRQARERLGHAQADVPGLRFIDFNRPANGQGAEAVIAPVREGRQRFVTYEAVQTRSDGRRYPCSVRIELLGGDGIESLVAFVEDTSERIAIESQLARKAQEYESLVRNLPDAISRARPDTTLTYVNDVYSQFMGKAEEELLGRKFADFIPESHREAALRQLAELTPENAVGVFEQPMIDHDGREFLFMWSNLMTFRDGKPVEILSVGRDITGQQRAQQRIMRQARELEQRNAALEQFTGIVTHDLKAPLRHIRSFTEMMIEDIGAGNTDDLEVYGQHIGNGVKRMERIISSLHEFSQVAYKTVRPQAFGLREAVEAACGALASLIADSGARVAVVASVPVNGDFELFTQLMQNLIGNAVKYVEPGVRPNVEIEGVRATEGVEIRICDNGIGIPAEQAENVFAIFRRLHRDESAYAGDGIGLALCRRIVEAHGGTIALDTSYEPGCRFVVRLPA